MTILDDINKPDADHEPGESGKKGKICDRCGVWCEWKHIPNKGWRLYNGFKPHVCGSNK